jgi:hypothetical protein
VKDEEIGFPLLIGMNAILALQGVLLVNGNEQKNPLFGIEANLLDPRPVLAAGLLVSFVSQEWVIKNETIEPK